MIFIKQVLQNIILLFGFVVKKNSNFLFSLQRATEKEKISVFYKKLKPKKFPIKVFGHKNTDGSYILPDDITDVKNV